MSSKYAELETKQKIISLQGQAKIVLEMSILKKLFRTKKKTTCKTKDKKYLFMAVPKNVYEDIDIEKKQNEEDRI